MWLSVNQPFLIGNQVSNWNQGSWQPSWIKAAEAEAVKTLAHKKDIFQVIYVSNKVSVTMYMNIRSYLLIC